MISADEHGPRSRDLAQRFLRTAVVVDDKAFMDLGESDGPTKEVVAPDRHTQALSQGVPPSRVGRGAKHTLNAGLLNDSFSALGVSCDVVGPEDEAIETMRQADIVILDWFLQDDDPGYTLKLLRRLLAGEADRNSLRRVAIYTGEARLEKICAAVSAELKEAGLDPIENEARTEVRYGHGRVVLYAKSGVNLAQTLTERSVAEEKLPGRLIEDFASVQIVPTGSSTAFKHQILAEHDPAQAKLRAYESRIRELRGYAAEDGYDLREASHLDFWQFVRTEPGIRRGSLVLGDNGNLRTVWQDGNGTHLGLQFLGAGMVQYVIFKQRETASVVSRVAGRDTFDGLTRQIDAFDLRSLLYQ